MTTARKQAHEAVFKCRYSDRGGDSLVYVNQAADAASDVWEPIVRDCLDMLRSVLYRYDMDDLGEVNWEMIRDQVLKHTEALNE